MKRKLILITKNTQSIQLNSFSFKIGLSAYGLPRDHPAAWKLKLLFWIIFSLKIRIFYFFGPIFIWKQNSERSKIGIKSFHFLLPRFLNLEYVGGNPPLLTKKFPRSFLTRLSTFFETVFLFFKVEIRNIEHLVNNRKSKYR